MRRFLILMCLLFLVLPVAINLAGCSSNPSAAYCNGVGYGPKRTDIATINLDPKITGISLAYGQTGQLNTPAAFSCPPATAIAVSSWTYGSTNLQLADVSPSGQICGGTWNRSSAGGTPDFTICTPPNAANSNGFQGGVAYLTASAGGATSNTVAVYVHPAISSISIPTQTSCISQNQTLGYALSSATVVKDRLGNIIPSQYVGNLTYTPVDPNVVSIDTTGQATALNPGSTTITATLSQTSSVAGYFYTCPPASISLTYVDGTTSKTVQQGAPQPLTAVVKDVHGVTLTGVTLQYTSTNPTQIDVGATGIVTPNFPGSTSITAICQPPTCNSSPINEVGVFGNGKPVVSNSVAANTAGRSSTQLWVSSTQSQSFAPVDLSTGVVGAAIKMPYFPNSMVMNQGGSNLYFGSYRELMVFSIPSNRLSKEDTSVPGVVLGVSPDGATVVINDQIRKVFYLYNLTSGTSTSFGGVGTAAAFTPDSNTLYISGPTTLYVHSNFTGWSSYDISGNESVASACMASNNLNGVYAPPGFPNPPYNPFCGPDAAVTVPGVGAFITGSQTIAHAFCPDTTAPATPVYYPLAAAVGASTAHVAASNDGQHILAANPSTFFDIGVTVPTGACPANTGVSIPSTILTQKALPANVASINQVISDPNSALAFVTYNSSTAAAGAALPFYQIPTSTLGTIPLAGAASAPVAGVFAPDNSVFFVGTSGDNLLHLIDVTGATPVDIQQVDPKLLDGNGQPVAPQFLAARPRATT